MIKFYTPLRQIFTVVLIIISLQSFSQVSKVSAMSGNWTNASTWQPSGMPGCGDSITISSNHTVTVNAQLNYFGTCLTPMKVVVYGCLKFINGYKLRLPCGSIVMVMAGGSLVPDNGNNNSNYIEICDVVEWNSNATQYGPLCYPPYLPPCGGPLPVQLISFNASHCGSSDVCLNWQTASELNNDHFILERSYDGLNYERIATVASQAPGGNSHQTLSYTWSDHPPLNAHLYYLLKQTDRNKAITNSAVTYIKMSENAPVSVRVFPVPNQGIFTLQINGRTDSQQIRILLTNSLGEVVLDENRPLTGGTNEVIIDQRNNLAPGIFFCKVYTDHSEHCLRLLVVPEN